ncbi:uncharacterized protein UTRI_06194_B [Ustilago trichophora]|uniref:Uncharacterized protein n=1 Tax=Ustilago trichophora TaxID=86804 RepID=A0A5C3EIN0_9BASI|nr:uncharacterized protein UTRI_06194_B [Ustilago trichophora]
MSPSLTLAPMLQLASPSGQALFLPTLYALPLSLPLALALDRPPSRQAGSLIELQASQVLPQSIHSLIVLGKRCSVGIKIWLLSIFLLVAVTNHAADSDADPRWFGPELPDSFANAHDVHPLATEMERKLNFPHGQLGPAYLYSPQGHFQIVDGHLASPTTRFFEVNEGERGQVPVYASPVYATGRGQRPALGLMFFKIERMGSERVITPTFLTGVRPDYLAVHAKYPLQYLEERATLTLRDLAFRLGPLHANLA